MIASIVTEISDAIVAANDKFMAVFKTGDAAALANLFTENGQILPPNGDFITGRKAIADIWQSIFDMGVKEIKLDIVELDEQSDTAIEISNFTLYNESGAEVNKGKYIVIWKLQDGQWKMHRDIFNSSMPAS